MKKAVLIAMVALAMVTVSCGKEEKSDNLEQSSQTKVELNTAEEVYRTLLNRNNPYDTSGLRLVNVVRECLLSIDRYDSYNSYMNMVGITINNTVFTYPSISQSVIGTDTSLVKSVMHRYIGLINSNGIVSASSSIEDYVLHMNGTQDMKNSLLCAISQFKFVYGSSSLFLYQTTSWFGSWDNCMYYKSDQLFNHSNWIDQASFIVGIPFELCWWVASCAWDASVESNNNNQQ